MVDDLPGAFAARLISAYARRPEELFGFALAGGSTARPCYERLAAESLDAMDWLSVNVYWGDERCVPADHPDSNQLLGRQALLEKVGAANAVYPMNCEDGPDAYQLRLGVDQPDHFVGGDARRGQVCAGHHGLQSRSLLPTCHREDDQAGAGYA